MPRPEDPREEALRRLDERANALEARTIRTPPDYGAKAAGGAYKILGEMIGGVFVGLALGWVIGGFVPAARPWSIIVGTILGFVVSIWLAMRTARRLRDNMTEGQPPAAAAPFDDEDED